MEIPFGDNITDGKDHGGDEDFMCPESVEQEVVEHDDTSIVFPRDLSENLPRRFILRCTDSINHGTDGSHPKQVHHDSHHQDYH